jgi:EmrB/QacA subfamily drug resistance transporter
MSTAEPVAVAAHPHPQPQPQPHPQAQRRRIIFAGLLLVMLLAALDQTIVSTALPTIVSDLGGLERISWVVTAYLLAQTVVTPLYGKLGDLYGRKRVLQVAVILFLIGSALCGASRTMLQLILFRALQGMGGGGLMVTSQAVIGDVVSPRERGRYQGIFGAVFGLSSIAGPLIGGFFTTNLSWRWIFYINLPLGGIALAVIAVALPAHLERVRHAVDYLGAALLAIGLGGVILATDLGGVTYSWGSPLIVGMTLAALVALVGFVWAERRAAEPVLPLHLFRNRVFTISSVVSLIVGFSMFGAITYLPLFLQLVRGQSPTASGLQLLPMMGGMLLTSIVSGQVISRTGKYRFFPIAGTFILGTGLFLLSRIGATTSPGDVSLRVGVAGVGLGMVMQVLVLAAQNAVEYQDLGVATAGVTLFRSIGGSLGTAVLGALFAGRVAHLAGPGSHLDLGSMRSLAPAQRAAYAEAISGGIGFIFAVAAAIAAVGFVLSWLLQHKPLRDSVAATGVSEAFAPPMPDDPHLQIERAIFLMSSRDTQRRLIERIADRAGVDLTAAACFLLARVAENPRVEIRTLSRDYVIDLERLETALRTLTERGLIVETSGARTLTPAGQEVRERLIAARVANLSEMLRGFSPERHAELAKFISNIARNVTDDAPAT